MIVFKILPHAVRTLIKSNDHISTYKEYAVCLFAIGAITMIVNLGIP
jgi:uncharacterized membrane protein